MIKFRDMTKDQKQKAILIVVGAIVLIIVLKQFVIGSMISSRHKAVAEYEELKAKLDAANKAIVDETETLRELHETRAKLDVANRDLIPSPENLLAWATKSIYGQARAAGVDVESVAEAGIDTTGFMTKEQSKLAFKPYGVKISAQCSFAELVHLVKALEESNPYICISGITVSAQQPTPEKHMVSMVVEWPSWKEPAKSKAIQQLEEKEKNA